MSISRVVVRRDGETRCRIAFSPTRARGIRPMRYMMFIKHTEDYRGKPIPPALVEAMGEFIGEYTKKGKFIEGAGLKSSHEGKRVQLRGGRLRVIDGPFTESKELVGGYAIVEAESDQEALDIATRFM